MDAQSRARKQWLQKQFTSSGVQLDPAALNKLVTIVADVEDPEKFLGTLLDEIETGACLLTQARKSNL
jgi:hypothetical protein